MHKQDGRLHALESCFVWLLSDGHLSAVCPAMSSLACFPSALTL